MIDREKILEEIVSNLEKYQEENPEVPIGYLLIAATITIGVFEKYEKLKNQEVA